MLFLQIVLWLVTIAVAANLLVLAVECFAACFSSAKNFDVTKGAAPKTTVLIPAHNEAKGLSRTLESVCKQLDARTKCLVVADNCEDETASIAKRFPVTVIERHHQQLRGKGFALDHGLAFLKAEPPDVVMFIDADCEVAPLAIRRVAGHAFSTQRPAQGGNSLDSPEKGTLRDKISSFAFHFKNHVRPLGLGAIGGNAPLFGTGMAIPWNALQCVSLGSSNIVEDLQLGVDLAIAGYPTTYVPIPCVRGTLPSSGNLALTQRGRWEQGHMRTLITQAPVLFWNGLRQRRLSLILQGLDLSVFPLSFLAILIVFIWAVQLLDLLFVSRSPAGLLLLSSVLCLSISGFFAAWWRFGRTRIQLREILLAPVYVLWKIPMYFALFVRPQKGWISLNRWH